MEEIEAVECGKYKLCKINAVVVFEIFIQYSKMPMFMTPFRLSVRSLFKD